MIIVALGANIRLGSKTPEIIVKEAISSIRRDVASQIYISRYFATSAFPAGSGPDFVNAVVRFESDAVPDDLLAELHRIEATFDRERDQRWGPRTLDLDLLVCDDQVAPDVETWRRWADLPVEDQQREAPGQLILPHPRLQDRAFVLVPMADVAPEWRHPVLGLTVCQMRDRLPPDALADVRPLG